MSISLQHTVKLSDRKYSGVNPKKILGKLWRITYFYMHKSQLLLGKKAVISQLCVKVVTLCGIEFYKFCTRFPIPLGTKWYTQQDGTYFLALCITLFIIVLWLSQQSAHFCLYIIFCRICNVSPYTFLVWINSEKLTTLLEPNFTYTKIVSPIMELYPFSVYYRNSTRYKRSQISHYFFLPFLTIFIEVVNRFISFSPIHFYN